MHKDLKWENKELHERASQLSADLADFKSTEREKKIAIIIFIVLIIIIIIALKAEGLL